LFAFFFFFACYSFLTSFALPLLCIQVVTHPKFDSFILLCIIINCFFMAVEDPVKYKKDGRDADGEWPGHVMYVELAHAFLLSLYFFGFDFFVKTNEGARLLTYVGDHFAPPIALLGVSFHRDLLSLCCTPFFRSGFLLLFSQVHGHAL